MPSSLSRAPLLPWIGNPTSGAEHSLEEGELDLMQGSPAMPGRVFRPLHLLGAALLVAALAASVCAIAAGGVGRGGPGEPRVALQLASRNPKDFSQLQVVSISEVHGQWHSRHSHGHTTTALGEASSTDHWPTKPSLFVNSERNECLQVLTDSAEDKVEQNLGMRNCTQEEAHNHWAWFPKPKGQIVTFWNRRCVSAETSKKNGAAVFMADCSPSDPFQHWERYDGQLLKNKGSGKCLDAGGPHLWDCFRGNVQSWNFSSIGASNTIESLGVTLGSAKLEPSVGEQAALSSIYQVNVSRTDHTLGIRVKGTGFAEVTFCASGKHDLAVVKLGDFVIAVDGAPAVRGQDVRRLMHGKRHVLLKMRRGKVDNTFGKLLRVAVDAGSDVGYLDGSHFSPDDCKAICLGMSGCKNFGYHAKSGVCHFKSKCMGADEPMVTVDSSKAYWVTYYRDCNTEDELFDEDAEVCSCNCGWATNTSCIAADDSCCHTKCCTPEVMGQPAPALLMRSQFHFKSLERVALHEGSELGQLHSASFNPDDCEMACSAIEGCRSFAYHPPTGVCNFQDKCVADDAPMVAPSSERSQWVTYYRVCSTHGVAAQRLLVPAAKNNFRTTKWLTKDGGASLAVYSDRVYSVQECETFCDKEPACLSFAYGYGHCFLQSQCVSAETPLTMDPAMAAYKTHYKACGGITDANAQPFVEENPHLNSDIIREVPGISTDAWQPLQDMLRREVGNGHSVVHVGNENGLLFRFGTWLEDSQVRIASEMKIVNAVLTMRLVELGYFALDDPLHKWLDWWPTEITDSRSSITVRHCLSFTTGFYGVKGATLDGRPFVYNKLNEGVHFEWNEMQCKRVDPITCAKLVLSNTSHIAPPGVLWTYSNDHLRLAVAVMASATGKNYQDLIKTHILDRTTPPMRSTSAYDGWTAWSPGAAVFSTAEDYQRFLDAYFNGRLVSRSSQQAIETDEVRAVQLRWFLGDPREGRPYGIGNFGFGTWRSLPAMRAQAPGFCGYTVPCAFAPSHFDSIAVLVRGWGSEAPTSCNWTHSQSCSFYYHIQNLGNDDSTEAFFHNQNVSRTVEALVTEVLSGARDKWQCHDWDADDQSKLQSMGNTDDSQKQVCGSKSSAELEFVWSAGVEALAPGCGPCLCCKHWHPAPLAFKK